MNLRKQNLTILLAFILLAFATYFVSNEFIESKVNDFFIKKHTFIDNVNGSDDIVLVVIDDKSIEKLRWPWLRSSYSDMFEFFQTFTKAKVAAFDAMISSSDVLNSKDDLKFFQNVKNLNILISGFDVSGLNFEQNAQLNTQFLPEKSEKLLEQKFDLKIKDERSKKISSNYVGIINMPEKYLENVQSFGAVTLPLDKDGVVREIFPVINYKNKLYPSLALSIFSKVTGIKDFYITDKFLCSSDNCKSLKIPLQNKKINKNVPSALIRWYKPINEKYTHKSYSAIDILDSFYMMKSGKKPIINPEEFRNKIVIIGANANTKSLEDRKTTSLLSTHAGVDIQASIINNMLSNTYYKVATPKINLLICLGFITIIFVVIRTMPIVSAVSSMVIMMCVYFLFYNFLLSHNTIIGLVTPIALGVLTFSFSFSYKFMTEGRKKDMIQNAMGKYISKDIMKSMLKNIENVGLGGKRANVTILFADIRGFTSIAENLPAEEVGAILNEYFGIIEPVIREYKGVLNKFIGDAVLAIFGEPIQDKDHVKNAVLCADKILKKVKALQNKWELEGKPKIEIGVGINTGDVFVGNIGTEERLEYTVIGDVVNTASRIEGYNKVYKTKFLISESTYRHVVKIADVIKIREVPIRGRVQKINIYEVLRIVEK